MLVAFAFSVARPALLVGLGAAVGGMNMLLGIWVTRNTSSVREYQRTEWLRLAFNLAGELTIVYFFIDQAPVWCLALPGACAFAYIWRGRPMFLAYGIHLGALVACMAIVTGEWGSTLVMIATYTLCAAFATHLMGQVLNLVEERRNTTELVRERLETAIEAKKEVALLNAQLAVANRRLVEIAQIDSLTGLLNRRGLEAVLFMESRRAVREDSPIAGVLIDCDNFKSVNDRLGHAVGDLVLRQVAQRIESALRAGDRVGRIGGDEFLAIMPATRLHEAVVAAERIRLAVGQVPLPIGDNVLETTVSIGVESLTQATSSIEDVLTSTRLSLMRSKEAGKNQVSSRGGLDGTQLHTVVDELRWGKYIHAVAQPILKAAGELTVGFELLARRDREPFAMPADFFRIALENNILASLDSRCAQICLREATARNLTGRVHINLFPSTLISTPIEQLLSIFPAAQNGTTYCLEISEQLFIGDPSVLKVVLTKMRENGVLIAMDDVGFGRTSLETLLVLEPDIIKIDRSYIRGVAEDRAKLGQLKRMVHAVGMLGADLIAEGVERREDLDIVIDCGIEFVQGYLWGQPE
jgi:diguanylate cyclase (GGDEF)-like protein